MKRRLIVCADGTWNTPDEESDGGVPTPTNVGKIHRAISAQDASGVEQKSYYEFGVGTKPSFWDKWFGGGLGKGIDEHILNCYKFLVQEYSMGDEIYLFGFSRGAYTVRSLAGLIRNSGLLRREHAVYAGKAYDFYRDRDASTHPAGDEAKQFRHEHSYTEYQDGIDSTPIECIGVWDTVGALGVPLDVFKGLNEIKYSFHDTTLSGRVKNAFHALAIDERRGPFKPTLWRQPNEDAEANRNWLEQAWFTGVHSNVGGGCPDAGLSDTALVWMKDRVSERTGLRFDGSYLEQNAKPDYLGFLEDSFTGIYTLLPPYQRVLDDIAAREKEPGMHTWEYAHITSKKRFEEIELKGQAWNPPNFDMYRQRPDAIFEQFRKPSETGGDSIPRGH